MLYPINLFVLVKILVPSSAPGRAIDLKAFYYANYGKVFVLTIVSAVLSIFYNLFILNLGLETQVLQMIFISFLALVKFKQLTQEWIHKMLSVVLMTSLVVSIIVEWNVWLIE